jgi:hypothetical protein
MSRAGRFRRTRPALDARARAAVEAQLHSVDRVALMHLVGKLADELSVAVLSRLLGLSLGTATVWCYEAGNIRRSCAAVIVDAVAGDRAAWVSSWSRAVRR